MPMQVFSFGEVLIDMLSNRCSGDTAAGIETFTKYPGGAPANVAVAVARLGIPAYHVGKVSKDSFGAFLIESLKAYDVSTEYVTESVGGKTALAFVSLDASGERTFSFYDDNAAHNDFAPSDFPQVLFAAPAIFNFSSGTLAKEGIRASNTFALAKLRQSGSVVCMDINFRPGFWPMPATASDVISAAASQVDIIKSSLEELNALFGADNSQSMIEKWLAAGVSLIVLTDGGNFISYHTRNYSSTLPVPDTQVVDTTAAGDAFVGGLLAQVASNCASRKTFIAWLNDAGDVQAALEFAARCGAFAVSKFGAFPSLPKITDVPNG
ncbi:MAG: carbohydrate kinase family protein [Pseudomonadales bacterium]